MRLWMFFFCFAQFAAGALVVPSGVIRQHPVTHLFESRGDQVDNSIKWSSGETEDSVEHVLSCVDALLEENSLNDDDDEILHRIVELEKADVATAERSALVMESSEKRRTTSIPYEWIDDVATQSLQPVFTATETKAIQSAAEELWATAGSCSSRFTYQYEGNSEAHVSDFVNANTIDTVNNALTDKIYPMIREAFSLNETNNLYVYDALVIRYNATASAGHMAGQPLHRDFGLVSINVMLNNDFEGGGTFFENQLLGSNTRPVKPLGGAGHCLAHWSSQRHAGAGTVRGVRDILVFFVAAQSSQALWNARLKQCRDVCSTHNTLGDAMLCRMRHQRLALRYVPNDGEAFQYLGTALMEYADYIQDRHDQSTDVNRSVEDVLHAAVACLEQAKRLTPCDARVYNNLGISLSTLKHKTKRVEDAYQTGLQLLLQSEQAGCDVAQDLDSLSLNYGLYLANQDRFKESYTILTRTAAKQGSSSSRTVQDAHRLWKFCERNLS